MKPKPLPPAAPDIHPHGCDCWTCASDPNAAPRFADAAEAVAVQILVGLLLGVVWTILYDAITGGPGIAVIVGL